MEQFVNRFVKILYILIINDLSDKFYYLREHLLNRLIPRNQPVLLSPFCGSGHEQKILKSLDFRIFCFDLPFRAVGAEGVEPPTLCL